MSDAIQRYMRYPFWFLVAISLAIRIFSLTELRCLGQFHAAPFRRVLVRLIENTCFAVLPPYGQATHVKPIPRIGCSHYHEEETRQPIHRSAVALAYRLPMPRRQICDTSGPCDTGGMGTSGRVAPAYLYPFHKYFL